jgi:hypothetical protein
MCTLPKPQLRLLKDFIAQDQEIALALTVGIPKGQGNHHCGLLVKIERNTYFFHLAFHHDLRFDGIAELESYQDFVWLDFSFLSNSDPYKKRTEVIIKYAQHLHRINKHTIPYAALYNKSTFDADGKIQLGEGEHGFTCATFLLAFFSANFLPLLNSDEWPHREEDIDWHTDVMDHLIKHKDTHGISEDHINLVRTEKGCARFKPCEVTASSATRDLPASFKYCKIIGKFISSNL